MTDQRPTASRRIAGTTLLPGGRLAQAVVEVAEDHILQVDVEPDPMATRALRRDGTAMWLASDEVLSPAFIDIHCHGCGGTDAFGGRPGLDRMATTLWGHGVGAFVAALMTAPLPRLIDAARLGGGPVAATAEAGDTAVGNRAHLLGWHFEGPALSPLRSGGHDAAALTTPRTLLRSLTDAPEAWANVRVVTLAPELDGGPELIEQLASAGIVASVGHTDATVEVVTAAYEAGARSTTHLFNGMPPMHHRAPGPIGAALASSPFIELICDGVHVDGRLLAPVARAIGEERLILVSDAVALAASRMRRVEAGGITVALRDGRAVGPDGTLAGSRLLLDGMVSHAVRSGIPLEAVLRAATENPARLLGLTDRGIIAANARADVVVVSRAGRLRRVLTPPIALRRSPAHARGGGGRRSRTPARG